MTALGTKDERLVALADALASAAREGQVSVDDAARVVRHELRQRNKKKAISVVRRSVAAQVVIERYGADGQPIPTNSSPDALHSDHVFKLSSGRILHLEGQDAWLAEMPRLCAVMPHVMWLGRTRV